MFILRGFRRRANTAANLLVNHAKKAYNNMRMIHAQSPSIKYKLKFNI